MNVEQELKQQKLAAYQMDGAAVGVYHCLATNFVNHVASQVSDGAHNSDVHNLIAGFAHAGNQWSIIKLDVPLAYNPDMRVLRNL